MESSFDTKEKLKMEKIRRATVQLAAYVLQSQVTETNTRGDEWSIKIFNCSQNFTFAPFARKI